MLAAAPLEQPWQPGSPRSPNGKMIVVPTPQGIALTRRDYVLADAGHVGGATRMLRAKELEGGYIELQGCTVNDEGTAVACVRGGRAFVGTWDAF
jgi:hypothetical protein